MKKNSFVLILWILITYSAHAENHKKKSFMIEDSLQTDKTSKQYEQFFKACLHHAKGEHRQAQEMYRTMFLNKTPEACNKSYIKLLFDSQDFHKVLRLTEKKFAHDETIQLLRAQSFLMLGNDQKAEIILKNLVNQKPEDFIITYQYTVCLMRQNKNKEALATLEKYLESNEQTPQHAMLYFLKSKLFLINNDQNNALDAINIALIIYPRFDQGILLKSMLLQQMGKVEEAVNSFQDYLNLVNNPQAEQQLINMLIQTKKYTLLSEHITKSTIPSADYFYMLGNKLLALQEKEAAQNAFIKACSINPNFTKAWHAQLDSTDKSEKKKLLRIITKWLATSTTQLDGIQMLQELQKKYISSNDIIKCLNQLHMMHKTTPETLAFLVDLYYQNQEYTKGLSTLTKIFSFHLDPDLKASILFNKAYGLWMLNKKETCIELLKKALIIKPNDLQTSNLLAHAYLENNAINAAEIILNDALQKNPNHEALLKTKEAVILKKQENTRYQHFVQNKQKKVCSRKKQHLS